jgi:hypothetical protein
MMAAMAPLQAAAGHGFGIWYSVHERKSGGSVADAARGSSATGGTADILMSLRKPDGNHPETIRKISSISRFPETPAELVIDWSPSLDGSSGFYLPVGESDTAVLDRATASVMRALPMTESCAKTMKVLMEETCESRRTVKRALDQLGAIRLGDDEKGNRFRYYRKTTGGEQ